MKELSIEEKAARYDKAIEIAKNNYDTIVGMDENCTFARSGIINTFHHMFPELKESEDKGIIHWIRKELEAKYVTDNIVNNVMADKALAWLEKHKPTTDIQNLTWEDIEKIGEFINIVQNENPNGIGAECLYTDVLERFLDGKQTKQKPINYADEEIVEAVKDTSVLDMVEPKFKVGDWIISNVSHEDYRICKILKIKNGEYVIESIYGYKGYNNFETFDKDYHLWTIQDAKPGDVLADTFFNSSDNPLIFILKDFKHTKHGFAILSDYHSFCFLEATKRQKFRMGSWHNEHNLTPATKEQRDLLFQKMHEAGYEWNAEKKELSKIEDKPVAIIPKFKVGDIIRHKKQGFTCKIIAVDTEYRLSECSGTHLPFEFQDFYELVEQNPAWNEEDENRFRNLIYLVEHNEKSKGTKQGFIEFINRLKSLKDRYTWKPSDEQIEALESATENCAYSEYQDCLRELIGQLKKLMDE